MKPKILVIGGSGFVGKEVVGVLREGGHAVRATCGVSEAARDVQAGENVEWVGLDLENSESISAALQGCVAVIHAAGYEPAERDTVDAAKQRGLRQLRGVMDACLDQGVVRIVYVSSTATINGGDLDRVYDETDFYTPGQSEDPYFEVKYSMEAELYRYFDKGLEIVVALPSLILGPGCFESSARQILKDILTTSVAGSVEKGQIERLNVVDVRDVGSALVAALERGRAGRRYVLGGINTDVGRLGELFNEVLGATSRTVENLFGHDSSGRFIDEMVDKMSVLGTKQVVDQVAGYLPEPLKETLGVWKAGVRGSNLQSMQSRWYGVHVNSQRARGELGHRPRLLSQTIEASVERSGN